MIIGVIGTGRMALGIVQENLLKTDNFVKVFSRSFNSSNNFLKKLKEILSEKIKLSENELQVILNKLSMVYGESDFYDVNLIIECAVEDLEVKQLIFKKLEQVTAVDTIFATNTSSLSVDEIFESILVKERCLGLHFFNPVPLMDLVELVSLKSTNDLSIMKIEKEMEFIGKTVIKVTDTPGFIVNRLLIPLINDAINLSEEIDVPFGEIDQAMTMGAKFPIGPLRLSDTIGNDIVLNIMNNMYSRLNNEKYKPSDLLVRMVKENKLGKKTKLGFYKYE